jgi:hypothetical protein
VALQSIKYGMPFPSYPMTVAANPSLSANVIDAAGEKVAIICKASAAKSIRKVHFRTATVTAGDTVDVRIETVDATTGAPTGTLWAANTNVAHVVANGDGDKWNTTAALTADATMAVGDVFAIVIVNGGGGGNIQISRYEDQGSAGGFPYGALYTSSWAKQATMCVIFPEYSDATFEPILGVFDTGTITPYSFGTADAITERGNMFSVPFRTRALGAWAWGAVAGNCSIKLYDTDGTTVLATTGIIDTDIKQSAGTSIHFHPFTAPATLQKNVAYRVVMVTESATQVTIYDFEVSTAAMMNMFPGGTSVYRTVKTSGVWSETATIRTYIGVFLDAFDDGSSSHTFAG